MSGSGASGVVLVMLGVLGLYLVWKTDVVDRIVTGAGSVKRTNTGTIRP